MNIVCSADTIFLISKMKLSGTRSIQPVLSRAYDWEINIARPSIQKSPNWSTWSFLSTMLFYLFYVFTAQFWKVKRSLSLFFCSNLSFLAIPHYSKKMWRILSSLWTSEKVGLYCRWIYSQICHSPWSMNRLLWNGEALLVLWSDEWVFWLNSNVLVTCWGGAQ